MPLSILVIHCRYKQRGGEETVVANEVALLKKLGHHVTLLEFDNRELSSFSAITHSLWHPQFWRRIEEQLALHQFDILHGHNIWPQLPLGLFNFAKKRGVATVHTQHNYRAICANGLLFRGEKRCMDCLVSSRKSAVFNRCYRDDFLASAYAATYGKRYLAMAKRDIDLLIALTPLAKSFLLDSGIAPEKLEVKPNYVGALGTAKNETFARKGCLFVGRFSQEKGIHLALRAARKYQELPFIFIGDGPLFDEIASAAPANVKIMGWLESNEIRSHMHKAKLLLLPSRFIEGMPQVALEAIASGLPIVALDHLAFVQEQKGRDTIALATSEEEWLRFIPKLYAKSEALEQRAVLTQNAFASSLDEAQAHAALIAAYEKAMRNAAVKSA